jgi:hypothetical protein
VSSSKGEYRVLDNRGNDGLIVYRNGYYCHSGDNGRLHNQPAPQAGMSGNGNNAISFMMYFYGLSYNDAVDYLCSGDFGAVSSEPYTPAIVAEIPENPYIPPISQDYRRVMAHMCKVRGFDADFVRSLIDSGELSQDSNGNACFRVMDFGDNPQLVGYEVKGTNTFKKFQSARFPAGFGYWRLCGNEIRGVIYFETAIDLLSYEQLHKNALTHHLLVSMGGLKTGVVDRLFDMFTPAEGYAHVFAVDRDDAGNDFWERMQQQHPFPQQVRRHSPTTQGCKDWNDVLCTSKGLKPVKYPEQQKTDTFEDDFEEFTP